MDGRRLHAFVCRFGRSCCYCRLNEHGRRAEHGEGELFTPTKKFWPAIEYNYTQKDGKGECHDLMPGFIWKYTKGASLKLAAVFNVDSSMSFRDDVGVVGKVFYRF